MPKLHTKPEGHFRPIEGGGGIEMIWSPDGTAVEIDWFRSKFSTKKWKLTIAEADELRRMLNDHID